MPTVDYVPFATDPLANVMTQADYLALSARVLGFQAGIANSAQLNKTWRQSSMIAAVIAQYVAQQTGANVLDDGNVANLLAALTSSIASGASLKPSRIVTVSVGAPLTVLVTDYAIGFNRVAAPAASAVPLPAGTVQNQEYVLEDLAANAAAFPITVSPPAGHTFAGLANYVMNVNRQSARFRYYGSSIWSVAS